MLCSAMHFSKLDCLQLLFHHFNHRSCAKAYIVIFKEMISTCTLLNVRAIQALLYVQGIVKGRV